MAAGCGVVDGKEFEKKSAVLQQCREKIESVCFDLRLRKVSAPNGANGQFTNHALTTAATHAAAADSLRRRSFHTLTPAHSASGRGEAGGRKKIEGGG